MKKVFEKIKDAILCAQVDLMGAVDDCRGDLATNTVGSLIIGVVVIGLLVVAANAFFPNFFEDMFSEMERKLSANW